MVKSLTKRLLSSSRKPARNFDCGNLGCSQLADRPIYCASALLHLNVLPLGAAYT